MKLSDIAIGKFNDVWRQHYKEQPDPALIRECAEDLFELGKIIYHNRMIKPKISSYTDHAR